MATDDDHLDVPSPIDLRDPDQAAAWLEDTVKRRPWRPRFFAKFTEALASRFDRPFTVVELGSGPGHLAATILAGCEIDSYVAVDFSEAMHDLAKRHLGAAADRVRFVTADFGRPWHPSFARADAIVTMQAAHELRHKRHQPALLARARGALAADGLLLFCDHYWEPGSDKPPGLYFTRSEQPEVLAAAGFGSVTLLHDEGGMALYACLP